MGAGDVIYQVAFEKHITLQKYDFHKTTSFVTIGFCLVGLSL